MPSEPMASQSEGYTEGLSQQEDGGTQGWTATQQSQGTSTGSVRGTKAEPLIMPLELQYVKAYFSALEGRISQRHYTHPNSEMCYRCPFCGKIINPEGLTKHTSRHFLSQHNVPNREYIFTLNPV